MLRAGLALLALSLLLGCSDEPTGKAVAACIWDIQKSFPGDWRDASNAPTDRFPALMKDCMAAQGYQVRPDLCPNANADDVQNAICYRPE